MRRRGAIVVLGIAGLTIAGLALTAVSDDRVLAFTLGVRPTQAAAVLTPGSEACQGPIAVPESADSVHFPVATAGVVAPPLQVTVREAGSGRVLGRGRVAGGYAHDSTVGAAVAGVGEGRVIEVCVRNRGETRIALNGGPGQAARTSALVLRGRPTGNDMALVFQRAKPASMASLVPDAVERASLFKASWVSSALLAGAGIAFFLGVPWLLAFALTRAAGDSRES